MWLNIPKSLKILIALIKVIKLNKIILISIFFILTQWALCNIIPLKGERDNSLSWSYCFKNSFINPIMAISRLSKSIVNSSSSFLLPFLGFLLLISSPPKYIIIPVSYCVKHFYEFFLFFLIFFFFSIKSLSSSFLHFFCKRLASFKIRCII